MQARMLTAANRGVGRYGWLLGLGLGAIVAGLVVTRPAAPPAFTKADVAPEDVEELALYSLAVDWWWEGQADPDAKARLVDAYEAFVRDHSAHSRAFNYQLRAQDLHGTRDLNALAATLDAAAEKACPQLAHNTISFANLCFRQDDYDQALARYEAALAMPACPPDRRGEAEMMMGTILRRRQDYERARQAFEGARQHTDRFPAIEAEMALIDLETGRQPAKSALGTIVHLRDDGPPADDREQVDPVIMPVFRDYEIHDRGMAVHVLASGCHEEGTTEIAVATGPTPSLAERWPSGRRTVRGLAWLANEAVVVGGCAMPLFNPRARDVREAVGATRYAWSGPNLIAGPIVESGAIEDGCDGE